MDAVLVYHLFLNCRQQGWCVSYRFFTLQLKVSVRCRTLVCTADSEQTTNGPLIIHQALFQNYNKLLYKITCRNKNKALEVVYFDMYFVFFSITLTSEVVIFCHGTAWKCSKRWALTLTPCRVLPQCEVPRHHRKHWPVCTNCPLWSHSCSRHSAGISAHLLLPSIQT